MTFKTFLIPITLVLGLILGALGLFGYNMLVTGPTADTSSVDNKTSSHGEDTASSAPVFVEVEAMTVNLAGSREMLYAGLSLAVAEEAMAESLARKMPEVRDRTLMTLSSANAERIRTAQGKQQLAATLKKDFNENIQIGGEPLAVDKVLFNNFVIQ